MMLPDPVKYIEFILNQTIISDIDVSNIHLNLAKALQQIDNKIKNGEKDLEQLRATAARLLGTLGERMYKLNESN